MSSIHTLTLVAAPEDESLIEDRSIECPGVSPECALWVECPQCADDEACVGTVVETDSGYRCVPSSDDPCEERHGVHHHACDGQWFIQTDTCGATDLEEMDDAVYELFEEVGAGTHRVRLVPDDAAFDLNAYVFEPVDDR